MNPKKPTSSLLLRALASTGGFILALHASPLLRAQEAPSAPAAAASPAPMGLISNSGFEFPDSTNPEWPSGWGAPKDGSYSWEREPEARFIRLNVAQPGELVLSYNIVKIPSSVKAVELSLRARIIGLKCGPQPWFDARIMADFKSASGEKLKGAKAIVFRRDTEGWVERAVRFHVPEGGAALEIMPTLFRAYSGTFDIDDLQLTPIDPSEVDPKPVVPAATP